MAILTIYRRDVMKNNIVLFYPRLGWMDTFVLDLPLSIIYAANECQKNGVEVRYVDQRTAGNQWKTTLLNAIDQNTLLVGFSCMSGAPILNALEATRLVKKAHPNLPTVWGGQHVTICPEQSLLEVSIDYIIQGIGTVPLYDLTRQLETSVFRPEEIDGLGWKHGGQIRLNPVSAKVEYPPLNDLVFDGLDITSYTRFNYAEQVYSLFTSFGCPHQCKFCFAPIFFSHVKGRRWFPYQAQDVIDHVCKMAETHKVGYISLLDENFFLDLKRAETILRGVLERGVHATWGIRGARIDDLHRMDDDFLKLLVDVGVKQIMIGAESGSQRMLDLMKKGIKVEQTIAVNQKLSRFPSLRPSYNFLSGIPGETIKDMYASVDLILQLMRENPQASFSGMNQFVPFPGSSLYDQCVEKGFHPPKDLEHWSFVDTHYNREAVPWLGKKFLRTLHAIQSALMFADDKARRELAEHKSPSKDALGAKKNRLSFLYKFIIVASQIYRPFALWRLKNHFFSLPIEHFAITLAVKHLSKITAKRPKDTNEE